MARLQSSFKSHGLLGGEPLPVSRGVSDFQRGWFRSSLCNQKLFRSNEFLTCRNHPNWQRGPRVAATKRLFRVSSHNPDQIIGSLFR